MTNSLNFNNGDINGMYDPDEARLNRSIQRYKNNMISRNDGLEVEEDDDDTETYRLTLTNTVTNIKKIENEEAPKDGEN